MNNGFDAKDENVPCKTCGRIDLPLHYNRQCPECFSNIGEEI